MTLVVVPIVALIWILPIDQLFGVIYKGNYKLAPELFRLLALGALAIPLTMTSYVLLGMTEVRRLFLVSFTAVLLFVLISIVIVPELLGKGEAIALASSYWILGLLSFILVKRLTDISLIRLLGRWRDASEFARRGLSAIRSRFFRRHS